MKNVLLLGGSGLVGRAFQRRFKRQDVKIIVPSHDTLDLENRGSVEEFALKYSHYDIDLVINCSGFVGGVNFNRENRVDSYRRNNLISLNILNLLRVIDCENIIDIGSVCMYPSSLYHNGGIAKEEYLFNIDIRDLDSDMAGYGLAKLHALHRYELLNTQLCLNFCYLIPTNLYGIEDKFDERANVIPSLINKYCQHIEEYGEEDVEYRINMQGNGENLRDFLYVDDFADIIIKIMYRIFGEVICKPFNICTGVEYSIKDVWQYIQENFVRDIDIMWGYKDGLERKPMDNSKLQKFLGDVEFTSLEVGLSEMINWYKSQQVNKNIVRL